MSNASKHRVAGSDPAADSLDAAEGAPQSGRQPKSLNRVLSKNEQIRDDVDGCADDLSAVNSALQAELKKNPMQSPTLKTALEQNDGVEARVQDCADDLTTVNLALKAEVKEREVLEEALFAARAREKVARDAAFHDPLTALPNRMLFNDRLDHGLAQAARHGRTLAVMFIDLDGFKAINDTHGHQAGDVVLKAVAMRLNEMTRDEDTLSRQGGDEFLYLVLDLRDARDATTIAEKIIRKLAEPCTLHVDGPEVRVTVGASIGIAIFPADGTSAEALLNCADKAMYRAKRDRCGYALSRE